jgi:hypothetical protein
MFVRKFNLLMVQDSRIFVTCFLGRLCSTRGTVPVPINS